MPIVIYVALCHLYATTFFCFAGRHFALPISFTAFLGFSRFFWRFDAFFFAFFLLVDAHSWYFLCTDGFSRRKEARQQDGHPPSKCRSEQAFSPALVLSFLVVSVFFSYLAVLAFLRVFFRTFVLSGFSYIPTGCDNGRLKGKGWFRVYLCGINMLLSLSYFLSLFNAPLFFLDFIVFCGVRRLCDNSIRFWRSPLHEFYLLYIFLLAHTPFSY